MLRYLNRHFEYLWDTSMFATAIYAVLNVESRRLRLACAGHPPPLLYRPGTPVTSAAVDAVVPLLLMEIDEVPTTEVTAGGGRSRSSSTPTGSPSACRQRKRCTTWTACRRRSSASVLKARARSLGA